MILKKTEIAPATADAATAKAEPTEKVGTPETVAPKAHYGPSREQAIIRQNALSHVFQGQWFANFAVTIPSDKVIEVGLKKAEEIERWINR